LQHRGDLFGAKVGRSRSWTRLQRIAITFSQSIRPLPQRYRSGRRLSM
jgi:hypothetical protein